MSEIDDIKIKNVKTELPATNSKLENIHSELDSPKSIREKQMPVKETSIPEKNTIPKKEDNTKFSKREREETIKSFLGKMKEKNKLKRKETIMIKNAEYDATSGKVKEITITLAVLGIILVVVLNSYLPNDAMFALLIIIGATSFLPMGMIMGWLLFDPVMRCKILRKMSKRNYGVIQFVSHGGKMFPKIKNFDQSLILRNNECWVLAESRVYQMTKDGNAINKGKEINAKNIVTYVDTVPVLFLDTHNMSPMKLTNEGDSSVYPVEIGSQLKAWTDNQRAKMMAVKKMEDMMTMILIAASVGAVVICLITMTKVEEMSGTISALDERLQFLIESMKSSPP